jgi:hypothetical protein
MLVKEVDEKAMSVMEQTLLVGGLFDMYDFMLEGGRGRRGSTEGKKEEKKTLGDLPLRPLYTPIKLRLTWYRVQKA